MTEVYTAQHHPGRRLSDSILKAFHKACDQKEIGIAQTLLKAAEAAIERRRAANLPDRRESENLIEAHHRLWHLKHDLELLLER